MHFEHIFEEAVSRIGRELVRIAEQNRHLGRPTVDYYPCGYFLSDRSGELKVKLSGAPAEFLIGTAGRLLEALTLQTLSDHRIKLSSPDQSVLMGVNSVVVVVVASCVK